MATVKTCIHVAFVCPCPKSGACCSVVHVCLYSSWVFLVFRLIIDSCFSCLNAFTQVIVDSLKIYFVHWLSNNVINPKACESNTNCVKIFGFCCREIMTLLTLIALLRIFVLIFSACQYVKLIFMKSNSRPSSWNLL